MELCIQQRTLSSLNFSTSSCFRISAVTQQKTQWINMFIQSARSPKNKKLAECFVVNNHLFIFIQFQVKVLGLHTRIDEERDKEFTFLQIIRLFPLFCCFSFLLLVLSQNLFISMFCGCRFQLLILTQHSLQKLTICRRLLV